jgi:hypothetical protein
MVLRAMFLLLAGTEKKEPMTIYPGNSIRISFPRQAIATSYINNGSYN